MYTLYGKKNKITKIAKRMMKLDDENMINPIFFKVFF